MLAAPCILANTTILPAWVVLPLAILTMLVTATHVLAVHQSDLPLRRRRIRVVNGLLMLVVTALLAYALGMSEVVAKPATDPAGTREFVIVWVTIIGLVGMVVALAIADAAYTVFGGFMVRKQLRREMREALAKDLGERRGQPTVAAKLAAAPARNARRGG